MIHRSALGTGDETNCMLAGSRHCLHTRPEVAQPGRHQLGLGRQKFTHGAWVATIEPHGIRKYVKNTHHFTSLSPVHPDDGPVTTLHK
jgi:hypothetical protein